MTKSNLSTLIDQFGALRARQAELEAEEKALKTALGDLEPGAYEGDLFRLTITTPERTIRDEEFKVAIDALIEENFSRQYVRAHTEVKAIRTLRVSARNGKKLAG